jgi:hypothetical protein
MSTNVTGTIEQKGFGFGTWALVTDAGETYELKDAPDDLCQEGAKAKVKGKIRDDMMTLAAIGPVLEVESFEIVS